jgi:hypothetical protein
MEATMKPEGLELSALFEQARHGDEPSDEDRRRVTGRVAEQLALGAGVGAAALTITRFGWATSFKTWGVVAVALAGAGSGAYLLGAPSAAPSSSVAVAPAPVVPRGPSAVALELAPPVVEKSDAVVPEPTPVKRERASASSPAPSSADEPGRLARETAALRAANEALRGGAPARALGLLDAFAKEFPGGVLTQEALATRVSALCALGRVSEARAVGTRFVQRYPRSPVAARVRGSCAMPKE